MSDALGQAEYVINAPNKHIVKPNTTLPTRPSEIAVFLEPKLKHLTAVHKDIARNFADTFGHESEEALSAEIFSEISGPLTEIFIAQMQRFKGKSAAWNDLAPQACEKLVKVINDIFNQSKEYRKFFTSNPVFAHALELLRSSISSEIAPASLVQIARKYEQAMIEAYNHGKLVLWLPYGQFYTVEKNDQSENPLIWEADASLVFSIPPEWKSKLTYINEKSSEMIAKLSKGKVKPFHSMVGLTVASAGAEALSQTQGESMESEGIFLALNLYKKVPVLARIIEMSGGISDIKTYLPYFALLYHLHEYGHANNPTSTTLLSEAAADLPAVASFIEAAVDMEIQFLNGKTTWHPDIRMVVQMALTECLPEALGEKTGQEGEDGYIISARLILNELVNSGVVHVDLANGVIQINTDENQLVDVIKNLKTIHDNRRANKEETIEMITNVELVPEARKLAVLFHPA